MNFYGYGYQNSVKNIDPTGQVVPIIAFAMVGVLMGAVNGYMSAKVQCLSGADFVSAVAAGAYTGGLFGAMAPLFAMAGAGAGVAGLTTAAVGISSSIASQTVAISMSGGSASDFSLASVFVSGALGGFGAFGLAKPIASVIQSSSGQQLAAMAATTAPVGAIEAARVKASQALLGMGTNCECQN